MSIAPPPARFLPRGAESWRDPYAMYAALRDHDPLHRVEDGDYWVLSRYDDVLDALRRPEVFSSRKGLTVVRDDMAAAGVDVAPPLVMLDPPEHTEFRSLLTRGFTPRRVESVADAVRAFVRTRLDAIAAANGSPDIVAELMRPLPCFVVAHYLGVDEADRERFAGWTQAIVQAGAKGHALDAHKAVGELFGYFGDLIERRRAHPADDTVSDLVRVLADDPQAAVRILGFAFTMIAGGNDTTIGLLTTAAQLLTEQPALRARVASEPESVGPFVEEALRLASPVQGLARTLTEDLRLHGRTVPAGAKVLLLYGSANRDPRAFGPRADEVDLERATPQHLAFGYGPHHCLGAAAARLQGRIALTELLTRFPAFTVDAPRGTFADGCYVRRYETLPFAAGG
ncbi:cytochrome P450 [Streptomyces endophyticus]|uniref:Cytochrome P450 n=1 Tax=Streptomyces endophyticus TaxID=714166 RepID=A0ABU6FGJ9_9ACTN|nr:cytochrome P450 [Streptomyces endophyticus]MEB8341956.1 cytochrome P450 [Streptomyces endophyticus]